ncbi:MAG: cation diffusion facilitator family transporter [Campylobacter curvus]
MPEQDHDERTLHSCGDHIPGIYAQSEYNCNERVPNEHAHEKLRCNKYDTEKHVHNGQGCNKYNHEAHSHGTHAHSHSANKTTLRNSFLIIFGFMLVEIMGGLVTNSLALLSDAGHMFSDAAALALSLFAFKFGEKKGTLQNTFGYKRIEILAAAINGIALIAIAVLVVIEAIRRLQNLPEVASLGMLVISAVGLAVNIIVALYMARGADTRENVNMRGAYLHVLGDALGSVGAIVAAILIMSFGWGWADAVASVLVSLLIAKSGYGVLKATFHILMEGAPANVDTSEILVAIGGTAGVRSTHDLHVWSITSGVNALSAHVVIEGDISVSAAQEVTHEIERKLARLGIAHVTIQIETGAHGHADGLICEMKGGEAGHLGHSH